MQSTMAKRKPKPPEAQKTIQINVKLTPELSQALTSYLNDQRPKTSAPEVLRVSLEDWLAAKGYWPGESGTVE